MRAPCDAVYVILRVLLDKRLEAAVAALIERRHCSLPVAISCSSEEKRDNRINEFLCKSEGGKTR
jgi:hypothetical protein